MGRVAREWGGGVGEEGEVFDSRAWGNQILSPPAQRGEMSQRDRGGRLPRGQHRAPLCLRHLPPRSGGRGERGGIFTRRVAGEGERGGRSPDSVGHSWDSVGHSWDSVGHSWWPTGERGDPGGIFTRRVAGEGSGAADPWIRSADPGIRSATPCGRPGAPFRCRSRRRRARGERRRLARRAGRDRA